MKKINWLFIGIFILIVSAFFVYSYEAGEIVGYKRTYGHWCEPNFSKPGTYDRCSAGIDYWMEDCDLENGRYGTQYSQTRMLSDCKCSDDDTYCQKLTGRNDTECVKLHRHYITNTTNYYGVLESNYYRDACLRCHQEIRESTLALAIDIRWDVVISKNKCAMKDKCGDPCCSQDPGTCCVLECEIFDKDGDGSVEGVNDYRCVFPELKTNYLTGSSIKSSPEACGTKCCYPDKGESCCEPKTSLCCNSNDKEICTADAISYILDTSPIAKTKVEKECYTECPEDRPVLCGGGGIAYTCCPNVESGDVCGEPKTETKVDGEGNMWEYRKATCRKDECEEPNTLCGEGCCIPPNTCHTVPTVVRDADQIRAQLEQKCDLRPKSRSECGKDPWKEEPFFCRGIRGTETKVIGGHMCCKRNSCLHLNPKTGDAFCG